LTFELDLEKVQSELRVGSERKERAWTNEGPGDTEEDCVEVLVGETVVGEAVKKAR